MKLHLVSTMLLFVALTAAAPASAQLLPDGGDDTAAIRALLDRLARVFRSGDGAGFPALLAPAADRGRAEAFLEAELRPDITRAVLVERDRQQLPGTLPGNGYRLVVDAFIERGDRARIATWQVDVRRLGDDEWRIGDQERLTSVDNLYRLSVNPTRQFDARGFTLRSEDLELRMHEGAVFTIDTHAGTTGLVLLGRGDMRFEPAPETERGQIRLFAGREVLESRFDAAYVRVGNLRLHTDPDRLVPQQVNPREMRRAEQVFREESPKAFALDLGELTDELWSLAPPDGDFLAEIRTRRFRTLTYVRSMTEAEDISLFDRRRQRNIASYASTLKLASRGRFYNEDDLAPYDVLDYEIDLGVTPTPVRQWLEGRARLRLRVRSGVLNQISLRLAEPLAVHSVVSREFGRLFSLRVRNQNTLLVNLPYTLFRGDELTLTIAYSGHLRPQVADREGIAAQPPPDPLDVRDQRQLPVIRGETTYLYSGRAYWYPQAQVSDYATAVLRISVPQALACVATGEPAEGSPTLIQPAEGGPPRKQYVFYVNRPVRYLAFLVSRFVRADRVTVVFDDEAGDGNGGSALGRMPGAYDSLDLMVDAHPLQAGRGRQLVHPTASIVRLYRSLIGDSPYQSFTLTLVESELPGGHSPAYFAALHQPIPNTPLVWRSDPVNFEGFPEFFLAHEIAHQWWGQAVGWRNYHEQWLSEGFAQYFAGLYAEHALGPDVFAAFLRQIRRTAMDRSDQGPVYLGYRLGHIRSQPHVFRALVYNKGAAVLHMLRRLLGDDVFFDGLRRFYAEARFTKAGTEDLRLAMEAESGRSLERFFERWIHGSALPQVTFTHRLERAPGGGLAIVLRFEQEGELFDLPVTVAIEGADRRTTSVLVPVTERVVEVRHQLDAPPRRVAIAEDGTLAEIRN